MVSVIAGRSRKRGREGNEKKQKDSSPWPCRSNKRKVVSLGRIRLGLERQHLTSRREEEEKDKQGRTSKAISKAGAQKGFAPRERRKAAIVQLGVKGKEKEER